MKNIILQIIFYLLTVILAAQTRKVSSSSQPEKIKVEISAKIELNSEIIQPAFWDNKIYTTEVSGVVSSYNITGKILWKRQIFSNLKSKPIISDGILVIATSNKDIITLKISNGEQIQSIGIDDSISTNLTLTQYIGDKELMMPKSTGSKSSIILGTSSGEIICYDLETLQEYWRNSDANGTIKTQPVIIGNKLLFTSKDGFLYCIDSRNGLLIWRWKEKAETDFSNSDILCDGKKIFVVDNDNSLFSIDILLGNLTWKSIIKVFTGIGFSTDKKKLFAKGLDNKFYLISAEKGKVLKDIKHKAAFESESISPLEYKKQILFTDKNSIFSINEKFKEENIFEFGDDHINFLTQIGANKFLISNNSGTIAVLNVK